MNSPITGKPMILSREKRVLAFRKEDFEIIHHRYSCVDSGETFTTTELDDININQLYNQYRVKHNIPFPDEIRVIREKYAMNITKMSEVLGFGTNSYRNYEAGEIPSLSNARLIQLAADPAEFLKLLNMSHAFESRELLKHIHKVETLIKLEESSQQNYFLEKYLMAKKLPDTLTGYRIPDFQKFTEMVVFFTEKLQPWKTKMNKLLFYADFTNFSKSAFSISGIRYQAIDMGPVPFNFQSIFEYLANNDFVDVYFTTFSDGVGEQFKPNPNRQFNPKIFTQQELNTLLEVAEKFKNSTTKEIINISHKEKAWLENKDQKKIIDYLYSFDLN